MHGTKVKCSFSLQSAPIVILSELLKPDCPFEIEWGSATSLEVQGADGKPVSFSSVSAICRYISRVSPGTLYGQTILEQTEIEQWIEVCARRYTASEFEEFVRRLNQSLSAVTYLVGDSLSLADVCVWSLLRSNKHRLPAAGLPQHASRWFSFLSGQGPFRSVEEMFPSEGAVAAAVAVKKEKTEDRGKSTELPGAELGEVVARFPPEASQALELSEQIKEQGNLVSKLKSDKADKSVTDANIKKLLKLKEDYRICSGSAWSPESLTQEMNKCQAITNNPQSKDVKSSESTYDLYRQINSQGDIVRKLKSEKADKSIIDENVKKLLKLREEYKACTGSDWKPNPNSEKSNPKPSSEKSNNPGPKKQKKSETLDQSSTNPVDQADASSSFKKINRLNPSLEVKKEENLAEWYSQVLTKSEMMEYYDISGCYILRPWSYAIWEAIKIFFDSGIKALGVTNCYFPMFVSSNALEKHIGDIAPEVAWVTKSGSSDLDKAIAIRPTSETVMYPSYSKWIRSHRDLPLRLNQWCNVVRWELRNPQPLIRTREILWQEGHTAFATKEEAENEVFTVLELYSRVYEHLLAVPVVKGRKTKKEKFVGADLTTTIEAYVPANGRGIQAATSHHFGQNFSKTFEITFEDHETGDKRYVYQNSWGLSTRTIGVMVMIHGDNTGLVLPPRIAAYQVVIIPCGTTSDLEESEKDLFLIKCSKFQTLLQEAKMSVKLDARDNYSPGWKFNYWEVKGVPLRIELGPKDIEKNQCVAVRRDTGKKITLNVDSAPNYVLELLDEIQESMFMKAKKSRDDHLCISYDWSDFCDKLEKRFIIQAPFCDEIACEEKITKDSAGNADENLEPGAPSMGAKSLCIPFEQPAEIKPTTKCIHPNCSQKPNCFALFGRSY